MSQSNTPTWTALPTGGYISTLFTYQSTDIQGAASSVYAQKSTVDAGYAAAGSSKVYTFKTDYERMQYKIGQFRNVPNASGY